MLPCSEHPCQKHPSTNTASFKDGTTTSGFPKTSGALNFIGRSVMLFSILRMAFSGLVPDDRIRDMCLDRWRRVMLSMTQHAMQSVSSLMVRACYYCGLPGGTGKRELRPYGPAGSDVCAECVLGSGAPPEREKAAREELGRRFLCSQPMILNPSEQSGPRPVTDRELGKKPTLS